MSLVNDMLRDLDQRRKDSEGPAARIRLTPAGDYPRQERRNWIPYIGLGLVIVASGLGYIWIDMSRSATSQQLATPVAPSSFIDTGPVEQIAQEVAIVATPSATVAESAPIPTLDSASDTVVTREDLPGQGNAIPEIATTVASVAPLVAPTTQDVIAAASTSSSLVVAPITRVPPPSVRSQAPTTTATEQIKDVTAPSPEQKDTIVVQEALRLIADNQPTAAYAKLEQNLLDNPYAHQSRETYAKFLMNQGDVFSARALIESGLELAPNHSGFKKVKARLLIEEGDIQSAVSLLESRAPAVSNDLEYHEILASAQLASKDFDGAALSYTGLVQQDQTQGRWWYGFAASQDALGNTTAAQQAYTRALEKPNLSTNLRRRSQDRLTALGR